MQMASNALLNWKKCLLGMSWGRIFKVTVWLWGNWGLLSSDTATHTHAYTHLCLTSLTLTKALSLNDCILNITAPAQYSSLLHHTTTLVQNNLWRVALDQDCKNTLGADISNIARPYVRQTTEVIWHWRSPFAVQIIKCFPSNHMRRPAHCPCTQKPLYL